MKFQIHASNVHDNFIEGLEIIKNNTWNAATLSKRWGVNITSEVDIQNISKFCFLFHQHFIVLVVGKIIFGDLNIYGPDGLRFYTQTKTITQRWPSSNNQNSKINFSMPTNN